MRSYRFLLLALLVAVSATASHAQDKDHWKHDVSPADRARVNPLAGQPPAIAAGAKLYSEHCSRCHGDDAQGRGKKPTLRGTDTTGATDGELAWILKNGDLIHSMPGWAQLPEVQRWQLVAYLRSLQMPVAPTAPVPPQ